MALPARIIRMQAEQAEEEMRPIITMSGDRLLVDSQDVARQFKREHKSVLSSIDTILIRRPELLGHNFMLKQCPSAAGKGATRETRGFDMDRDGFSLLVFGFTGEKALDWKLAYIDAFNAMEAALRKQIAPAAQVDPMVYLSNPHNVMALIGQYAQRTIELEGQVAHRDQMLAIAHETIEDQAVTVVAHERITNAHGGRCITDTAKHLGVGPRALFKYMRDPNARVRWLIQRSPQAEDVVHQDRLRSGDMANPVEPVMVHPRNEEPREKLVTRIYVTPRGLTRLARLIVEGQDPLLPVPYDMLRVVSLARGNHLFD